MTAAGRRGKAEIDIRLQAIDEKLLIDGGTKVPTYQMTISPSCSACDEKIGNWIRVLAAIVGREQVFVPRRLGRQG